MEMVAKTSDSVTFLIKKYEDSYFMFLIEF